MVDGMILRVMVCKGANTTCFDYLIILIWDSVD